MPEPVDLSYAISLPPEDAVNYFRQKSYVFSWNWQEVWQDAHAKAFTVAKAMKLDLLQDIRSALDKAHADGTTFQAFQNDLVPTLKAKGWWGKVDGAQLGSVPRLNTIFRTNIQSSYMAGRYKQQMENVEDRPYWQYVAVMDSRTRPAHSVLNGKVFRFDDPFWNTHYPPNGWRCRCRTRALSKKNLIDMGIEPESGKDNIVWEDRKLGKSDQTRPVAGYKDPKSGETIFTDMGWSSNPGKEWARWDLNGFYPDCMNVSFAEDGGKCIKLSMGQKTWKDYGRMDLRDVPNEQKIIQPALLKGEQSSAKAYFAMLQALGLDAYSSKTINTPVETVILKPELLPHIVEKRKDLRERYANFIIPTLETPYEIYLTEYEDGMRTRYVGLFTGKENLMAVVRINKDGSLLWNIMQANSKSMNKQRVGELLYGK